MRATVLAVIGNPMDFHVKGTFYTKDFGKRNTTSFYAFLVEKDRTVTRDNETATREALIRPF